MQPLEGLEDRLARAWSPVSHMNSVVNSDELRDAYNACLPKLSEYATEIGQNQKLFATFEAVAKEETLSVPQKKAVNNALRDFRLSGVDLPEDKKQRYMEIKQELSGLTSKFSENVLDATQAWSKFIEDETCLAGLPDSAIAMAKQSAEQKEQSGWLFTLEFPSYFAVMSYADDRALRSKLVDPKTNWMSEALKVLESEQRPGLQFLLGKKVNALTTEEMLLSYVAAAYLLEAEAERTPLLLSRIGAGEAPQKVIEEVLGLDATALDRLILQWLKERK